MFDSLVNKGLDSHILLQPKKIEVVTESCNRY